MRFRPPPLVVGDRVQHVERESANTARFGRIVRAWHSRIEVEWDDGERQIVSRWVVFAAPSEAEIEAAARELFAEHVAWKRRQDYRPESERR